MAEIPPKQGSKALKIILFIVLGLMLLCGICAGALWLNGGSDIAGMAMGTVAMQTSVQQEFGADSVAVVLGDRGQFTLAVGLPDEPTAEIAAESIDKIWKIYAAQFAAGGYPLTRVACGRASTGGQVTWLDEHSVSVEEVVARTNVPAPPVLKFIDEKMKGKTHVRIGGRRGGESTTTVEVEETTPDDAK